YVGRMTNGNDVGAYMSGLVSGTIYHFRLVASNVAGTSYGADESFTTSTPCCDFNADGKPDILWHNTQTGNNVVWFMHGAHYYGGAAVDRTASYPWMAALVTDFSTYGKPDILWHNTQTGDNVVWFMDGVHYSSGASVDRSANLSWVPI